MDRHDIILNKESEGYDQSALQILRKDNQTAPQRGKMVIFKPDSIGVFDNLYSKPTQNGAGSPYSMSVLFSVSEIIYFGQYTFTTGMWETTPGDERKREFKDREVQYWFYAPYSLGLFKKYSEDVVAGYCSDSITRIDEYVPGKDENFK